MILTFKRINNFFFIIFVLFLCSCENKESSPYGHFEKSKSNKEYEGQETSVHGVVVISAGSNEIMHYDTTQRRIVSLDSMVSFLPYPGNYGFISSTVVKSEEGKVQGPIPLLIISEAIESGKAIPVIPIGVLRTKENQNDIEMVIAIPEDESKQTIKTDNFEDFILQYDPAKFQIQEWFVNYKGYGKINLLGWQDGNYAYRLIDKWKIKN